MDVKTGELIDGDVWRELIEEFGEEHPNVKRFTPVPEELEHAANMKLNGQPGARVSKNSGGKLSRWAAQQRKLQRKAQRKARRKNRRG